MGHLEVVYLVLDSGTRVSKEFSSPYQCRLFINKIRHSKRVRLISYPNIQ